MLKNPEPMIRLGLTKRQAEALLIICIDAEAGAFGDGDMFANRALHNAAVQAIEKLRKAVPQ